MKDISYAEARLKFKGVLVSDILFLAFINPVKPFNISMSLRQ